MTEKDVMLMLTDTTVKTQLSVSNSLPLVTANGLSDISETALVKRTSNIKLTEWPNGTTFSKPISTTKTNFSTFILYK